MKSIPIIALLFLMELAFAFGCAVHHFKTVATPTSYLNFTLADEPPRAFNQLPADFKRSPAIVTATSHAQPAVVLQPAPIARALAKLNLQWQSSADADVVAYNLYYGFASRDITNEIPLGNVTNTITPDLASGYDYWFAVTAADALGNESDFSGELSVSLPLILDIYFPNPNPGTALESSTDMFAWSPRDAVFTNGVWRVGPSNDVPMEFYRPVASKPGEDGPSTPNSELRTSISGKAQPNSVIAPPDPRPTLVVDPAGPWYPAEESVENTNLILWLNGASFIRLIGITNHYDQ